MKNLKMAKIKNNNSCNSKFNFQESIFFKCGLNLLLCKFPRLKQFIPLNALTSIILKYFYSTNDFRIMNSFKLFTNYMACINHQIYILHTIIIFYNYIYASLFILKALIRLILPKPSKKSKDNNHILKNISFCDCNKLFF